MPLNKDKLKLRLKEVPFMGHILTNQGVKIDPEKVKAVHNMPTPQDPQSQGVPELFGKVPPMVGRQDGTTATTNQEGR